MTYTYRVLAVRRVVDGDTVDLDIDLGFHLTTALRFRLLGVDTPERGRPGATEATAYAQTWLTGAADLVATTHKADSFGRWLADITRGDGANLSADLIAANLGVPYDR